jgi:hypothetical protein
VGVITKAELSDPGGLRKPAGMPAFKRDPISEITAFDRYAGDRQRTILIAAGAGCALLVLYTFMSARPAAEKPALVAAPLEVTQAPVEVAKVEVAQAAPVVHEAAPAIVREEPAVVTARGMLHVESDPEVTVYEGTTKLGKTPLDVELSVGKHELRIVNSKLHLETKRKVEIVADGTRSLDLLFGVSKLKVRAPKGTKVYLDRRFVGETPLKAIKVVEGPHRLEVVYEDQRLAEILDMQPSTTVRYRPHFEER